MDAQLAENLTNKLGSVPRSPYRSLANKLQLQEIDASKTTNSDANDSTSRSSWVLAPDQSNSPDERHSAGDSLNEGNTPLTKAENSTGATDFSRDFIERNLDGFNSMYQDFLNFQLAGMRASSHRQMREDLACWRKKLKSGVAAEK